VAPPCRLLDKKADAKAREKEAKAAAQAQRKQEQDALLASMSTEEQATFKQQRRQHTDEVGRMEWGVPWRGGVAFASPCVRSWR
jgi:hypothetical protein